MSTSLDPAPGTRAFALNLALERIALAKQENDRMVKDVTNLQAERPRAANRARRAPYSHEPDPTIRHLEAEVVRATERASEWLCLCLSDAHNALQALLADEPGTSSGEARP